MNLKEKSLPNFAPALVILVLFILPGLYAEPVDLETAGKVAESQTLIINNRLTTPDYLYLDHTISTDVPKPLYDDAGEKILAYVFELEPHGFVVVTADDDLVPIVAYSELGSFCWEEHPENILLNMLREDLKLRLEAVELTDAGRVERYQQEWEGLIAGDPEYLDPGDSWPEAGSTWTGGWVESAWHQFSPYNDLCPIDPETGERCVVGCTGTAMAQIVNYWQYPNSVTFTEDDNYTTWTRGFEVYAPDASIPHVDYNDGDPNSSTCAAISYACGVGSKMNYTSGGSGAFPGDARASFLKHFKYMHAEYMPVWDTIFRDTVGFYGTLEANIKDSMPVMLSIGGKESPGNHAIVCDGLREDYYENNEWHLNFGWGEYLPERPTYCWYKLPEGMPYGYSSVYSGIVNIEPPTRYVTEPIEQAQVLSCSPNPFREYVRILFTLPEAGPARVNVYDLTGRCVRNLLNHTYAEGFQSVKWNGKNNAGEYVNSGVYFIRIDTRTSVLSQKVVFHRLTPVIDTIW